MNEARWPPRGLRHPGAPAIAVALGVLTPGWLAGGCGGPSPETASGAQVFIAFASDFAGFRSWPSHTVDSPIAQGATHVSGPRTVYINQVPPSDATTFKVGTMIVKVTESDGKIFARGKRGGGYNRTGALDWEWFELEEGSNGLSVKWHGVGPPAGEMYGGDPNGGCNSCHVAARDNDYVLSASLRLGVAGADAGTPENDAAASDDGGGGSQ